MGAHVGLGTTNSATLKHQLFSRLWPAGGWPPLLLPLVLAVVQVVFTTFAAENQPERDSLDALGYALLVAGPVALTLRHRYPVLVMAAVVGVTMAYFLIGYPYGPVFLSVIVALYTAVMAGYRLAAWLAAAVLYFGHFGANYLFDLEPVTLEQLLAVAAWLLVIMGGSELVRVRRDWAIEAERTTREAARRREGEERLRIARELHDVLGHHVSLINVQAGVALHVMDRQPEQARKALTAIEASSREVLAEMRSVLDILRQPEEAAPRAPVSGLERLDSVVSQARATGLDVRTRIQGIAAPLPAPVDAAAFRIIQESMTNVIRHAGASTVAVELEYGQGSLAIEVRDDGVGRTRAAPGDGGSGIAGMRERVAALGGDFEAGPAPGRGFRVRARLPFEAVQ